MSSSKRIQAVEFAQKNQRRIQTSSETDSQTPNSPKRRKDDKEESYTESKKEISDKVLPELRIARIAPMERWQELPNQKSKNMRHEVRGSDGNGEQILSILGGGWARLHRETVEEATNGMCAISEKDWRNDLGSSLFYIWDIYGSRRAEVISKVYKEDDFQ